MSIAQNVVTGIGLADGFADTYGELGDLAPRVVIDALGADGDVALPDLYERRGVSEIVDELSPAAIVVSHSIAVALESPDLMTTFGSPGDWWERVRGPRRPRSSLPTKRRTSQTPGRT